MEQLLAVAKTALAKETEPPSLPHVAALDRVAHNSHSSAPARDDIASRTMGSSPSSTFADLKVGLMRHPIKTVPHAVTEQLTSFKQTKYMTGVLSDATQDQIRFVAFGDRACKFIAEKFVVGRSVSINGFKVTRANTTMASSKGTLELQLNGFNVDRATATVHDDAIATPTIITKFSELPPHVGKHVTIACTILKNHVATGPPVEGRLHHPIHAEATVSVTLEVQDNDAGVAIVQLRSQSVKSFNASLSGPPNELCGRASDVRVFSNMLVSKIGGLSLQSSMMTSVKPVPTDVELEHPLPPPTFYHTTPAMYVPMSVADVSSLLTVNNALKEDNAIQFYVVSACIAASRASLSGPRMTPSLGIKLEDDSDDLWANSYNEVALEALGLSLEAFTKKLEAHTLRGTLNERFPNTVLARLRLRKKTYNTHASSPKYNVLIETLVAQD